MVVRNVPTNNLASKHINDGGDVPEAVNEPNIGEVTSPDDVWSDGTDDLENVFYPCFRSSQVVELYVPETSTESWLESVKAHEALRLLPVHAECPGDTPSTIRRMFRHDGKDLVLVLSILWRFLWFVVETRTSNAELFRECDFRRVERIHTLTNASYFFPHAACRGRRALLFL